MGVFGCVYEEVRRVDIQVNPQKLFFGFDKASLKGTHGTTRVLISVLEPFGIAFRGCCLTEVPVTKSIALTLV